jgi:hypothetical protein
MEPEEWLSCPQGASTGPYPELYKYSPYLPTLLP